MSNDLRRAIDRVAERFRGVRLHAGLALCWLAWAVAGLAYALIKMRAGETISSPEWVIGGLTCLALASALVWKLFADGYCRDRRWVARKIEAKHPELGTGLLAAVEEDAAANGKLGFLQSAVIREALEHRRKHDWNDTVPGGKLFGFRLANALALFAFVAVAVFLASGRMPSQAEVAPVAVVAPVDAADVRVDPGDVELERGTTLLVVARFGGSVPADANLVLGDGSSAESPRKMSRSLEDPTFAGRVESVEADTTYHVAFAGRQTPTYKVHVFEYPELLRTDAKLVYPSYTYLEPKTAEDIRHVTAVEGAELTLLCHVNKTVASAKLIDAEGAEVPLVLQDDAKHVYATTFTMTDPKRFKVQLLDKDNRANKLVSEIVVNVTRNRPPAVATTRPSHDVRVSPVEELALEAKHQDDFGVVKHGLSYAVGGEEPKEIPLGEPAPKTKVVKAAHLLAFESLKAQPDELVTYFFWAEDIGPDGKPRRASGDMFFAEVRHFEEIFRQGEQPPAGSAQDEQEGQQGNAQQAEELAELQKQIINGTWKLIRRETGKTVSDAFVDDAKLLQESQGKALEQADAMAEKLTDETSKASLAKATALMKEAEKQLGEAAKSSTLPPFRPALVAEQAAYQALLKLRAREFEVVRSNQRQQQPRSRSSSASQSQRQLNQLELTNEENRYEQQSQARAQTQKEQEQRETRQVVNRLRELAQRQNDLNDRVKEMQSALEAAKSEQAKAEIDRQLKRLREQQQQLLRDTDELMERMENEQNRERMAEARQQAEQSREHVRQASEALERNKLPQALTEGARAGREMDDLREKLNKEASNQFAEEMTAMRNQARNLDENQKTLNEKLDSENRKAQTSLRDTKEREEVKQGLEQQRQNLDKILDRMQNTVQEAEESQPLLAKNLYDTARKAAEQKVPDNLKVAERLEKAGIPEEAVKASKVAGQGIEQLRQGVEKAAESVLGDEVSSLKRAQKELDDLAEQVNRELARADTNARQRQGQQQGRQGEQGRQKGQQGQQGDQDQQQGRQGEQSQQTGQQGQQGDQDRRKGQQGQQKGQPGQQGQQPGEQGQQGQEGRQPGEGQQGQQQGQGPRQGQGQQQGRRGQGTLRGGNQQQGGGGQGGEERLLGGVPNGPGGPITGDGFRQWSDRMRDVEELLNDPRMRSEAARIRDRVRGERDDFKRHAKEPDPNKLKEMVANPINELKARVSEEVRRREKPDSLVPIDRDPVPPQFAEGVRKYYERLGSGR